MADFKSHLPVQTHPDGATFTASSDYVVGVAGYETVGGTLLAAAVTANREWMVANATLESVVYDEDSASANENPGVSILSVRQDTPISDTSADGDYQFVKSDSVGRLWVRAANEYAEDSAHTTGDFGGFVLAVRNDTRGTLVNADGDYSPFAVNNEGDLYVADVDAQTILSDIQTAVEVLDNIVYAEDSAHTTADPGAFILAVRNDTMGSLVGADGDYAPVQVDASGLVRMALSRLEFAEDSAHTTGDYGLMPLGVRQDVVSPLAADGDYIPFSMDRNGALRVTITDPNASATEVDDYKTTVAVAVGATANHDYTVTALKLLIIRKIWATASGRIKVEVILDPAGTPATKFVAFNSTANPNISIPVKDLVEVAAGIVVRIAITNLDNKAQDVYSTLLANEV